MERSFAEVVKKRLTELGMEQKELAKALDVSDAYVSRMLTGAALPPSITRSKIVPGMEKILGFKKGELVKIARLDRGNWQMAKARMEFPEIADQEIREGTLEYGEASPLTVTDHPAEYSLRPSVRRDRIFRNMALFAPAAGGFARLRSIPVLTIEEIAKGLHHKLSGLDLKARETVSVAEVLNDEKAYGLIVPDTSMQPRLEAGDKLVVSPNAKVRDDDIAVCVMGRDVLIRRVHFKGVSVVLEPYDRSMEMLVVRRNEISEMHRVIQIILD